MELVTATPRRGETARHCSVGSATEVIQSVAVVCICVNMCMEVWCMCAKAAFIAFPIKNHLFYSLNVFNYANPPVALHQPLGDHTFKRF